MTVSASFDSGVDFGPDHMCTNIFVSVISFLDLGPEMNCEVVKIHFERHLVSCSSSLNFTLELSDVLLFSESQLSLIFMLKFLLIRVDKFFLNDFFLFDFLFSINLHLLEIVLDHHDSLLFVVPGSFGLFTHDFIVARS